MNPGTLISIGSHNMDELSIYWAQVIPFSSKIVKINLELFKYNSTLNDSDCAIQLYSQGALQQVLQEQIDL